MSKKKSSSRKSSKSAKGTEKKGRNKLVIIGLGICGCLLLCAIVAGILGGIYWWRNRNKPAVYTEEPIVNILNPSGSSWYASSDDKITLSGIASDEDGEVKKVEWEVEGGERGSADGQKDWKTESISLKEGDNKIVVKATDDRGKVGEDSIFVVYNKDVVFVEDPTVSPGTLFKGDPEEQVIFRAKAIQKSNKKISEVLLYSTDANGEIQKKIGKMLDNGKVANGDDIPGDGTYSFKTKISEDTKDTLYYRVVVNLAGSEVTGTSSLIKILIIPHASEETVEQINNLNNQVNELTEQLNEANISQQEIANQINDLVSQQPNIAANGISEQGQGVWWVYENTCIPGGVLVSPPGTKGGKADGELTGYFNKGLVSSVKAQDVENEVNSTKAIYLGPFLNDFAETDDYHKAWKKIKDSKCPKCETVEKKNNEVTVEHFKNLDNYGLVVVSSHGDNWYGGLSGDNVCAEGLQQSQVIIYTNQQLTKQNLAKYEADLMARRLAVGADNRLIILPAYIDYYNGNFPNSLIYIATCRSTYNNSMAAAFLGKGAGAYFGFDDYVLSSYAGNAGDALFDNFLLQGDTTTVSFSDSTSQVGASDGQGADFTWVGESTLKMGGKDFSNTGFEEGGKNGWATGGDSRVITSLGPLTPREGNFMMIISTGLGSVSNSKSSVKQNVCYSKSNKTLKFDYNIVSEEPKEYLNSAYDDRLEVYLVVDGKKTRILSKGINDSKWKSVSGIDFAGGDSTTFMTGWKSFSYSLKNVPKDAQLELKFEVSDVGDSAYDTAALIDNVRFE